MFESLKRKLFKDNYKYKKEIAVNPLNGYKEPMNMAKPVHVVDGDPSKKGYGDIEISFKNVENEEDIFVETDNDVETEMFEASKGEAIYWISPSFNYRQTITIYYDKSRSLKTRILNSLP